MVREMWARMPLAEAVLRAWRWLADDAFREDFYRRQRGCGRQRILTFAVLLQLIADAAFIGQLIAAYSTANEGPRIALFFTVRRYAGQNLA